MNDLNGPDATAADYRVLARKYRPSDFDGLIGQEALVRTLTNAIQSGRLAHAFILTGVRGVGKTTTARIIARALNCIGTDGNGGPTAEPCGECENCVAIAEDRHVDVMEMDAASRTGVDDIRELIEGVRYRPTSARYKVYIIDEVHMLSKNAFNALLKTLEEPPEHVKFIFATTETRKVPVTVLSRCQRFDLKRVDEETLGAHFASITEQENAKITAEALHLICRAADGSVRDGLSLLDQAITLSGDGDGGEISEQQVRDMLGLADRTLTFDLLEQVMGGDIASALAQLGVQYDSGADPVVVLQDLLELTHWLTRIKVVPDAATSPGVPESERVRGQDLAERLSMADISRAWQMLLKGLGEARTAPSPLQAAEMILVRLAYVSALPSPADAIKAMGDGDGGAVVSASSGTGSSSAPATPASNAAPASPEASSAAPPAVMDSPPPQVMESSPPTGMSASTNPDSPGPAVARQPEPEPDAAPPLPDPATFEGVVALTDASNDRILHANLINNLHLVSFEPGRIEFRPGDMAPRELAHDLSKFLNEHTARRWVVTVNTDKAGDSTWVQKADEAAAIDKMDASKHPLVQAALEAFPGAKVESVKMPEAVQGEPVGEDTPPFEPEDG